MYKHLNRTVILASKSPRRREYLSLLGIKYECESVNIQENFDENLPVEKNVMAIAEKKAKAVTKNYDDALIIGADTTVVLNKKILGKPKSAQDAENMLTQLQGEKHAVYTGICVIDTGTAEIHQDYRKTDVFMQKMDKSTIKTYINTKEPFGKAGAYAIQGMGSMFIEKIYGCYFNVLGLPINALANIFQKIANRV